MKDFYLYFPDENLRHKAAEWHAPRLPCHTREIKSVMHHAQPSCRELGHRSSLPSPIIAGFAISVVVSMPFAKARGLQQRLAHVLWSLQHISFLQVEPSNARNFQLLLRTTWTPQFPASPRTFTNKLLVFAVIPQDLYPTSSCRLGLAFRSKQTGLLPVLPAKSYKATVQHWWSWDFELPVLYYYTEIKQGRTRKEGCTVCWNKTCLWFCSRFADD